MYLEIFIYNGFFYYFFLICFIYLDIFVENFYRNLFIKVNDFFSG